jgi:hypothetical protein
MRRNLGKYPTQNLHHFSGKKSNIGGKIGEPGIEGPNPGNDGGGQFE